MPNRWRAPNNPTVPARQVWSALFPGHPWPRGWRVQWAGFMRGCSGLTIYAERRVLLSYGDARRGDVLGTLLHEFVHVRCPGLRHGAEFRQLEKDLCTRLGLVRSAMLGALLHEFIHARCGPRLRHRVEFRRLENDLRARLGLAAKERQVP